MFQIFLEGSFFDQLKWENFFNLFLHFLVQKYVKKKGENLVLKELFLNELEQEE